MWLAVTGVSLYFVVASLVEVFGSWRDITEFAPAWLLAMALLQAAAVACLWALQRLALRSPGWRPVIASELAGNASAKIAPGGGAVGAALQSKMLVEAGIPRPRAVAGLTATGLLVFGFVLALPVLALPALSAAASIGVSSRQGRRSRAAGRVVRGRHRARRLRSAARPSRAGGPACA
jgi:hypothetical protein